MGTHRHILIVEDEPVIAWTLADMVRDLGHDVCGIVATESEAVADAAGCDAVLMDVRLAEGGSGISAAKRIRENYDLPIVFCTAFASQADIAEQVLSFPKATLISKPVSSAELKEALGRLLG